MFEPENVLSTIRLPLGRVYGPNEELTVTADQLEEQMNKLSVKPQRTLILTGSLNAMQHPKSLTSVPPLPSSQVRVGQGVQAAPLRVLGTGGAGIVPGISPQMVDLPSVGTVNIPTQQEAVVPPMEVLTGPLPLFKVSTVPQFNPITPVTVTTETTIMDVPPEMPIQPRSLRVYRAI